MAIDPRFQRPTLHGLSRFVATAVLAALITACAAVPKPKPQPVPVAVPRPAPAPRPVPAPSDWRDAAQTPGTWTWSMVGGYSVASFGMSPQKPDFQIMCGAGKSTVTLRRAGIARIDDQFVVTTTTTSRPLPVAPDSDSGWLGWVSTSVSPRDPLLDAIAFSRGRFRVEVARLAPLYLPSWPEISRVIEDCR